MPFRLVIKPDSGLISFPWDEAAKIIADIDYDGTPEGARQILDEKFAAAGIKKETIDAAANILSDMFKTLGKEGAIEAVGQIKSGSGVVFAATSELNFVHKWLTHDDNKRRHAAEIHDAYIP